MTRAQWVTEKFVVPMKLVLAYVWSLQIPRHAQTFALRYQEVLSFS